MEENKKGEILLYQTIDGVSKIEVTVYNDIVWLLDQVAELFQRNKSTISLHIKNIFDCGELQIDSTVAKFATVQNEGNRSVTRNVEYYNLDVIISVGYRVKSQNGIIFRKWANKVLKEYLLKGYSVNQKRLEYLEKTIKLIDIAGRIEENISGNDAKEIIKVINTYANALTLLDDYDHRTVVKPNGIKDNKQITYKECMEIISKLKFNSESDIFALERNHGLKSIINNIYLSFDGKDVYTTIEEKAANFLYLIIKNHTFIDGNKRIAATLFIYFLKYYDILIRDGKQVIDNNTLVAMTLLIAQSNPKEKEILVDLVMNFLKEN